MGFSISECFSTRGTSYPNARLLLEVAISLAFLLLVGDLQEELLSSEKKRLMPVEWRVPGSSAGSLWECGYICIVPNRAYRLCPHFLS